MADDMAVPGETTIDLGEHKGLILRPGYDALCEIERDLAGRILPIAVRFENGDIGMRDVAVVLYRCSRDVPGNPKLTMLDIGRLVQAQGYTTVLEPVVRMLGTALKGEAGAAA